MYIEVISNINMNSLKFYMKEYKFIEECSFGNYLLDLLDETSSLYTSKSEVVVLFMDIDEFIHDFHELINSIKVFVARSNKTIVINTISYQVPYIDTFLNNTLQKEIGYNSELLNLSQEHSNIILLDFLKLTKANNLYDEKYWYLGKIKFSKYGFEIIANELNLLLKTYKYGSRKVLILDMDNTLWGGVIGEEEVKLSNDGVGKIYQDFQKKIKLLKELGVLLCICSKNNHGDGIAGLNHLNSILHQDDFIIKKINWENKATNIQQIAKELNLGESSLVFIDDNPVERNIVNEFAPDVETPSFPEDIYTLNSWFLKIINKYFSKINLTKEDLDKQKQYEAKIERNTLESHVSYEEFLKSLNMEVEFFIDDLAYIERYAQMTQKTNQFNLTTKRYTVSDIKRFVEQEQYRVIAVNYKDKFANEGLTGLVILEEQRENFIIDSFLLSCRILKRGVENKLFDKIDELAQNKNIIAQYIPTSKNEQTKDLYKNFGFDEIEENKYVKRKK